MVSSKIKSHIINFDYKNYNIYCIITQLKTHNVLKLVNEVLNIELIPHKKPDNNIVYKSDSKELCVFLFKNNENFFKKHKCDYFIIIYAIDTSLLADVEKIRNKEGILGFYQLEVTIKGLKELIGYAKDV